MEAAGYDGAFTFEGPHDPFLPLVLAADATERLELTTAVAIAFARSPMTLAHQAWDLQALSGGRFHLGLGSQIKAHIERRFSMPWSAPGGADARARAGDPGHLGDVAGPDAAPVRGRALHAHAHDAVLRPGAARRRPAAASGSAASAR